MSDRREFDPCCGKPPTVTEWRPGCYGAQCPTCGCVVGNEQQLDRTELMAEWNSIMRKRSDVVCDHVCEACFTAGCKHAHPHGIGVKSLNGLDMGDCTDERCENVCCVSGKVVRVRCVPAFNAANQQEVER